MLVFVLVSLTDTIIISLQNNRMMQSNAFPVVHRKCQTDTDIKKEMEAYYEGRRRPAMMMGCDSETFTEQDVNVSLYR